MMRKIFGLLSLLLTIITANAQDNSSPRTINATEFPVALYNGIPNVEIPLGEVKTASANFSLPLTLSYNLYASTNRDFSTNDIGDAWSLDLKPTITITPGEKPGFPYSYDDEEYSYLLEQNTDSDGFSKYHYSCFGLQGTFVIVKEGNNFYPKILTNNDYVEIDIDYSTTGNEFVIHSFTIQDKSGLSFTFLDSYGSVTTNSTVYTISQIRDKFDKLLATYTYSSSINRRLEKITVPTQGEIVFTYITYSRRDIVINNIHGETVQKFELRFTVAGLEKELLSSVRFFDKLSDEYEEYKLTYKHSVNTSAVKMYYGFPHTACGVNNLDENHIHFDHGALSKIVYPGGGTVFYEYEPNTYGSVVSPADIGSGWYNYYIESVMKNNANNIYFEQIPLTYNSTYGGYIINRDNYTDGIDGQLLEIHLEYSADQVQTAPGGLIDENGNISPGKFATPTLKVGNFITNPNFMSTSKDIENNVGYECQTYYCGDEEGVNIFLKIQPEFIDAYNYVRAYYVKAKPENELEFFGYAPGPRVKRIKSFDREVSSITNNNYVAGETQYKYNLLGYANTSSGYGLRSYPFHRSDTPLLLEKNNIMYRNVTVVSAGKGSTEYTFGDLDDEDILGGIPKNKESFPKYVTKVQTKNQQGQTTEVIVLERDYTDGSLDTNDSYQIHPVVSYEKATANVYSPTFLGIAPKLTTITESTFDTITRHLTHVKVADVAQGETFEEQRSYQQLGSVWYPTTVKKHKNGTMINQSKAEYAPLNNGTLANVYALKKISTAKGTQPFETEKEITKYDNKGNVLEYKTKEGTYVSQIWGYNDTKLVAELRNVRYNEISSTTISNIKGRSGSFPLIGTPSLEVSFNTLLSAHPNGFITTYTYIPMVGLKTTTDANGRKETYEYDNFNRLYRVLNHEGNIVKEYNYNIKN